jgi:predicted DNA-binding WGR domain protein
MLATRCDNIHLRSYNKLGNRTSDSIIENKNEADWDRNFTRLLKERVEKGAQETKNTLEVTEELNKKRNEYCKENTTPVNNERFVCNICSKVNL